MSKFITNFSNETTPEVFLRSLLKKNVHFTWGHEQEKTLESLKNKLITRPVLQFFDVNKNTVIPVDSSKSGVGVVLLQNLPCTYTSKALTGNTTKACTNRKRNGSDMFWFEQIS